MRKRNLSEFMCIEMLYDYKLGKLDPLRKQAVEEGMQGSPRVREELRKLMAGLSFCSQLHETKVEDALVKYILEQPKTSEKIFSNLKWSEVPRPVQWAVEAVVVAMAISLFIIQTPRIFHRFTRIRDSGEIVKNFDIPAVTSSNITVPEAAKPIPVANNAIVPPQSTQTPTPSPAVLPVAPAPVPTVAVTKTPEPEQIKTVQVAATAEKSETKKGNAYLYRMVMQSDDVDTITPEITKLITDLGGEKAGDVELGWRRKGGSYYHFSLPKINNEKFQEGLKKFGPFSITKSPHPRVMPPDKERFILWVEEKSRPSMKKQSDTEDDQSGEATNSGESEKVKTGDDFTPPGTSPGATNPEPDGKDTDTQ